MTFDPVLFVLAAASLPVAAAALLVDRLFGYPNGLQDWIGHPVEWIGGLIASLDRTLNCGAKRRLKGALSLLAAIAVALALTVPLTLWLRALEAGWIGEALLAGALLSQKSLEDHVRAVAGALGKSIAAAREAVARIVGRDPKALDAGGVARGAVESLAENMSDGVVAPLFWLLVAGLPGMALYKTVNTADSMIGHSSDAYRDFGRAAARLDDALNIVPARLTGWLIAFAAGLAQDRSGKAAVRAMARDARRHLSPNAGWPEAAMAGALGVQLGGPRSYNGRRTELAWMGDGREQLSAADIHAALGLYNTGLNILAGLVVLACVILWTA